MGRPSSLLGGGYLGVEHLGLWLVDERTLFYNAGGLDLKVGADGVQLGGGSLASILSASVTFTEPAEKRLLEKPLPDGQSFILYSGFEEAHKPKFNPTLPYLLPVVSVYRFKKIVHPGARKRLWSNCGN